MESWTPIKESDLENLLEKELEKCSIEILNIYKKYAIKPKRYKIKRHGNYEEVFVVAICNSEALYYEDVEEGFNFSSISSEGILLEHSCNQDDICYALYNWL